MISFYLKFASKRTAIIAKSNIIKIAKAKTMKMKVLLIACVSVISSFFAQSSVFTESFVLRNGNGLIVSSTHSMTRRSQLDATTGGNEDSGVEFDTCKMALMSLLQKVPSNQSTPKELTRKILNAVSALEREYPTSEADVVARLAGELFLLLFFGSRLKQQPFYLYFSHQIINDFLGNWELIWTAQDPAGYELRAMNPFATFINPLENQSYSNNPVGRSSPILPQVCNNTNGTWR